MNKSEIIKLISSFENREKIVNIVVEDENSRKLLFSLMEERLKDKSLDVSFDDVFRSEAEAKRIDREITVLHDSMYVINDLAKEYPILVQPVIPYAIRFLNYKYYYTHRLALDIIYNTIKTSETDTEIFKTSTIIIPRLLELLDFKEFQIQDNTYNNYDGVVIAIQTLHFFGTKNPALLEKYIYTILDYYGRENDLSTIVIINAIADHNISSLRQLIPDLLSNIPSGNEKAYLYLVNKIAQDNAELIIPAIPNLMELLKSSENQGTIAKIFGLIAQKNVTYAQPLMPILLELLEKNTPWITVNSARSLKIICQQDENFIDSMTKERIENIIKNIPLFDEIISSDGYYLFDKKHYYDLATDALGKNPENPEALKAFGQIVFDSSASMDYKSIPDMERGLEYLIKSAEIHPNFDIYSHIGLQYRVLWMYISYRDVQARIDVLEKSLYYYTMASQINPENIECQLQKVSCYLSLNRYDEAISLLEELYQKASGNNEVPRKLAHSYFLKAKSMCDENNYHEMVYFLFKAKSIEDMYSSTVDDIDKLLRDENIQSKIRSQMNILKNENNRLTKDINKIYDDAGKSAYSYCVNNSHNIDYSPKCKLDEILALDNLIDQKNQEMESVKSREKKSGFFAKLGDAVSSTTKQGKLKIDLINLEKKKNNSITSFGETLWISHKNGVETLPCLMEMWEQASQIDKRISDNINKICKFDNFLNGKLID